MCANKSGTTKGRDTNLNSVACWHLEYKEIIISGVFKVHIATTRALHDIVEHNGQNQAM